MLWDLKIIEKLLEQFKEHRVLWDPKHHHYSNNSAKHVALQEICNKLGIPVTPKDIHRKYRTMRAAYQVEVRNINAAKLRGFYYKPTLHWFDCFNKFVEETKEIKEKEDREKCTFSYVNVMEGEGSNRSEVKNYVIIKDETTERESMELSANETFQDQQIDEVLSTADEDESSSESEDEFQAFANHVAEQLKSMSVHRAVMIQNQIQRLFAKDREMFGEEE